MFAIVDILGFQEKVEQGQKLKVPLMKGREGDSVTLDKVLLLGGETVKVGTPHIAGASVTLKILSFGKTDKVRGAKFKRRKRYTKLMGHRQDYTEVEVTGIKG
jgi:large subunit ribosomal protein L21